jgi:glycosyltransferase involved in cell wall biosynthesis
MQGSDFMSVKITIIIPVYNTEKYLCKCLDSILAQTFTDFECILIDDFSEDNSFKICEKYAKKDNKIIVLKNKENMGASLTRKKGLDHAKGEYIQFVDSDDYIEKDMLEKMYGKASTENLDIVFCDFIVKRECGETYINASIGNKICMIKQIGVTINSYTACLYNKIIKRQIFDKVIFSNTNFAEDKYISLQTTYYTEKNGCINEAFYNYVRNSDSLSNNKKYGLRKKIEHFENYKLVVKFLTEKYGENIDSFEPELSDGINSLKMEIIYDKVAESVINVDELYLNANNRIFSKTWKTKFATKILLYMIVHKLPFARNTLNLYILTKKILY